MYLVKGVAVREEKRKVTTGFWKWRTTEEVTNYFPAYEVEIYGKTLDDVMKKMGKFSDKGYGLKVTSLTEVR